MPIDNIDDNLEGVSLIFAQKVVFENELVNFEEDSNYIECDSTGSEDNSVCTEDDSISTEDDFSTPATSPILSEDDPTIKSRNAVIASIQKFFKTYGIKLTTLKETQTSIKEMAHCLESLEIIADPNNPNKDLFSAKTPSLVYHASLEVHKSVKLQIPKFLKDDMRFVISELEAHTPPRTWYRNKKGLSLSEQVSKSSEAVKSKLLNNDREDLIVTTANQPITPIMNQRQVTLRQLARNEDTVRYSNCDSSGNVFSEPDACRCVIS